MTLKFFVLLTICVSVSLCLTDYDGHQIWRIVPKNEKELSLLRNMESQIVDFWQYPVGVGRAVDIRVTPQQILKFEKIFNKNGLDHKIVISDVQQTINDQMPKQRSTKALTSIEDYDYETYHSLQEIEEWGDVLINEFSFATKFQIGISFEGRPLHTIEIRKPASNGTRKPVIYVDTLIHAREWITAASVTFIFKEMLTNPDYAWMIDEFDWIYVPVLNVDGYDATWTMDRLWRKTRSSGASSVCYGIDPNRNFDYHWSEPGASSNPCSETFYGPTPASENVIRHLQDYIYELRNDIDSLLSIHSYSQLILSPYGYTADPPSNIEELSEVGQMMSDAIKDVHGMEYISGPSATTIYPSSGGTKDWVHSVAGITLTYSYELRDTGEYGFLLPENQIIPTGEELMAGIIVLANYVANKENNL